MKREVYLILHNIRSCHNVGSIFRTADAAGVSKIYLTGYTPAPHDRFGRGVKEIAKVALGAERTMSWEKRKDIGRLIENLKREKVFVVAVEQERRARDYRKAKIKFPCVFIFGSEVGGLTESVLNLADVIAEIPMHGKKESLNVSVAVGVTVFRMICS
ncbi:TrmH family RNA methyltransferase [Patescibacteria group bacterium]|nr:MAG: TrmH family RNA methyltransferase [Patescibacteria group bacterium]